MKVIVQTRDVYRYHHSVLRWDIAVSELEKDMIEIFRQKMHTNVQEQYGGFIIY